jgi:EmrB/QacA subfamily drug resistance transporter
MQRTGHRHLTGILLVILVCQLMIVLDSTVVNIALPRIQTAMHIAPANLSWVLNAYVLTFGGFLLLGARAGDLWGRKRLFMFGTTLFTLSSVVAGVSNSSALLLVSRAVQGLGGALAAPSALALLTISFPEGRERIRALAYYTAVSIGGSALGMVVGGMIVAWTSWRWIFFINLPIGIILVILAWYVLPETPPHVGSLDLDLAGALTSTIGMSAIVFGLVRAATDGWGDALTDGSFVAGAVLLTLFVAAERRATTPITPLRLFSDRNRSTSYVVRFLLVGGSFGQFFFLSQFLQEVPRYSAITTGLCFVPITTCLFVSSQFSARVLTGRVSTKVQMVVGLISSATGLFLLSHLTIHSTYPSLLVALVLFGTGNGLAFVPLTNLTLTGVTHEDAGAASGLVNATQQVGGALGLGLLVTVFGAASHAKAHSLATGSPGSALSAHMRFAIPFVAGAQRAFLVAAGLVVASLISVLTLKVPRQSPSTLSPIEHAEAEAAGAGLA